MMKKSRKTSMYIALLVTVFCLLDGCVYAGTSLSVRSRSMDNPMIFYTSNYFSFNDHDTSTQDAPWVVSDQYLKIEFDSTESRWGLRIITDNVTDLQADYDGAVEYFTDVGEDTDGDGEEYGDSDDLDLYSGAVYITDPDEDGTADTITDNPYYRVPLAWQVYDEDERTSIIAPAVSDSDGDGFYEEDNVSGSWCESSYVYREQGDWAYVGDFGDTDCAGDEVSWNLGDVDGDGVDDYEFNYNLIAWGYGTGSRNLSHHPHNYEFTVSGWPPVPIPELVSRDITDNDDADEDGDGFAWDDGWDIYVYLAGRFWNTHYFDRDGDGIYETAVEFQVPAGEYKTKIYIELFHE